jgi:hypothetical protein
LKISISFEYTGRDTPQRNSLLKGAFHTIAIRGTRIINAEKIPQKLRFILGREAFQTATVLDGLTVINIDGTVTYIGMIKFLSV